MKLPEDRICPNGWESCGECKYENSCRPNHYHFETYTEFVIKAAEIAEASVNAEVKAAIRETWGQKFDRMTEDERWADYRKYHVTDLTYKEPITCMGGPIQHGGGSSNNVKKENKGTQPTIYKWGVFKQLSVTQLT